MLATLLLTGLSFPLPVLGPTWIVDDNGGPGVDFTSIQAAINAASANDVLIVRAGTYASFTLDKGLRIVGEGGPLIQGSMQIENLPAQGLAVVSGLRVTPVIYTPVFRITNCVGTVVGEDLQGGGASVTNSLDVRLRGIVTPSGRSRLISINSRLEVVESAFHAFDQADQLCGIPVDPTGPPGAWIQSSELHAARSSFHGGDGGDSWCPDLGLIEPGGDGGDGILVWGTGGSVLLTGIASNELRGGIGGWSSLFGQAPDGRGLSVHFPCSARVSGATIFGQSGSITTAVPPDPTLRMLEVPAPGVNLTFRLVAPVGASAEMRIGAIPVVVPIGGLEEDVLVARAQTVGSGIVPAGGVLGFNFPIGPNWQRGTTVFAQANVTLPGGEVRRTHSIPIVVR